MTEIISVVSGKGGAGKTIIAASLGYALLRAGHRVLLIDADRGTDGLSLFLLGPDGNRLLDRIPENRTLVKTLQRLSADPSGSVDWHNITRTDHDEARYPTIVSGKSSYGDAPLISSDQLSTQDFCTGLQVLFSKIRKLDEFDYVIVDTRGGFSTESTATASLSDSIVVITEPDYTSFYQIRNLLREISNEADRRSAKPIVRGILVNRASELTRVGSPNSVDGAFNLDNFEENYRASITQTALGDFEIEYRMTHALPVDISVIEAYKVQQQPFLKSPASPFSIAMYAAFTEIMTIVTEEWSEKEVQLWNGFSKKIDALKNEKLKEMEEAERAEEGEREETQKKIKRLESLEAENAKLRSDTSHLNAETLKGGFGMRVSHDSSLGEEIERSLRELQLEQREVSERLRDELYRTRDYTVESSRRSLFQTFSAIGVVGALLVGFVFYTVQNTTSDLENTVFRTIERSERDLSEIAKQLERSMDSQREIVLRFSDFRARSLAETEALVQKSIDRIERANSNQTAGTEELLSEIKQTFSTLEKRLEKIESRMISEP